MSVIEVKAVHTQQVPGSTPRDRRYRSLYHVITDDRNDSPVRIYVQTRAAGDLYLPQVGDYYAWDGLEFDLAARVIRQAQIKPRSPDQSLRMWDYLVEHTTESTTKDNVDRFDNPLNEPWEFSLVGDEWTEEAFIDTSTGKYLTNSALEPWTGRETEIFRSRSSMRLTKNKPTLRQDLIDYSRGAVNSSTVILKGQTYPARTLLLRQVDAEEQHHAMIGPYYRYTFKIDTNEETFDLQAVDRGTREFTGTDPLDPSHYTPIHDAKSNEFVEPPGILLNGAGAVIPSNTAPIIRRNQKYKTADLNVWGFPS